MVILVREEKSRLCQEVVNRLFFSKGRAIKYSEVPQLFDSRSLFEEVSDYLRQVGIKIARDKSGNIMSAVPNPSYIPLGSLGKEASALLVYLIVKMDFLKAPTKRRQLDAELKGRMKRNRITMALNELKAHFLIKQEKNDIFPEWALDTHVDVESIKQRCSGTIIETTLEKFNKEESVD